MFLWGFAFSAEARDEEGSARAGVWELEERERKLRESYLKLVILWHTLGRRTGEQDGRESAHARIGGGVKRNRKKEANG